MDQFIQYLPQIKKEQKYVTLLAAVALIYSTYKLVNVKNKKAIEGVKEIPVPDGSYPVFGHMVSLGKRPGAKVREWHEKYGRIIQIKMGVQTWILVNDPLLAHKIFVTHGVDTSYRPYTTFGYKLYSKNGKGVAFSNPGSNWQKSRTASLAILAPKQIQKYADPIGQEAAKLAINLITATQQSKNGVNPLKYLELYAMNTIFSVCFGRKFQSVDDPEFKKLTHIVETAMHMGDITLDLANFVPMLALVDLAAGSQKKMKRFLVDEMNPTFKNLIKEARVKGTPNLVKTMDEEYDLNEEELHVLMTDLISGGTDTTTITMLWNFAIMCHHPEIQQKVAEEIDAFIKLHGHVPTFDEREHVPYCISVMKESMRYKPTSSFGAPHSVKKNLIIDGYVFPKDCSIICSMESIHKNPTLYPDSETFNPDRFLNNQKTMQSAANGKLEERDHYNFGWGRRICPGIYLAEMEMFNAFVQVFARCKVEPAGELPDINDAKSVGITLSPVPYNINFIKRANALDHQK